MLSSTTDDPLSNLISNPALPQESISSTTIQFQPRTPSFGASLSPEQSSEDSPMQLETPYNPHDKASVKGGRGMDIDSSAISSTATDLLPYDEVDDAERMVDDSPQTGKIIEAAEADDRMSLGSDADSVLRRGGPTLPADGSFNVSFPDQIALQEMRKRLAEMDIERGITQGDGWEQRDEFAHLLATLLYPALEQLPFLREQIEAQRDTIITIQEQTKLSAQLMEVERDRHVSEREGWHAETRALVNARNAEIAAGSRPKKVLDLDVGYHQDLEAANKRLEMDNRLMAPRLADTQRQIDNLVTELRYLRAHVVLSTRSIGDPNDVLHSPPRHSQAHPVVARKSRSSPKAGPSYTTMGDARTEHLLLAARKVRAMREVDDRVGRLTLKELQRGGVVGPDGGVGYSEGYGGPMEDEEDESDSDLDEDKAVLPLQSERRPSSATKTKGKNVVSTQTTPLLPRAKRSGKRSLPPTTPLRGGRSHTLQTDTTPGGSNFSDLLRAAEMAIRPGTPAKNPGRASHIPISAMSATRSTTRAREEGNSDDGSSVKRARRDSPSTSWARGNENLSTETREERLEEEEMAQNSFPVAATIGSSSSQVQQDHPEAFALDLLAQASQLDAAQSASQDSGTQLERVARFSGALEEGERDDVNNSEGSASEYGLAPAIDLKSGSSSAPNPVEDHQIDPTLAGLPRPGDVAATPKIRPRTQSFASDVHTPARTYNQHIYPTPDMAFDETPGRGISPPYMGRDDILADELPLGAFASPTGATVPGLGKYVHLTSSMPARRVRSPYLKWTIEEDELLARAVAIHGEKWDLVSKGVPTRSYHQVRQRWLRKTGAFDKKPHHGLSGLGMDDEEEEHSPTPGGRTPSGKKRKD